jgi:hypothetical protein
MLSPTTKTGTRQVCIRLPVDQISAFELLARRERRSRSAVMGLALDAFLQQYPQCAAL